MTEDKRLAMALSLAAQGWPLFPVTMTKLPAVKAWEQTATTDPAKIREWYGMAFLDGGCNFGFPPGRADIFVIDTDRNKKAKNPDGTERLVDGEDSLKEWLVSMKQTLPDTFTVRTPSGGLHRYFRAPGLASKNAFLPAVDIKTNGGYVVIAGSETEKGCYGVIKSLPVAELPSWFIEAYGRRKKAKVKPSMNYNTKITPDTEEKLEHAREIFDSWPPAEEGERNDSLYQLMREVCKAGVTKEKALELYAECGIDVIGFEPDSAEVINTTNSAYSDPTDMGSTSAEGRKLAVNLFDVVPDAEPLKGTPKTHFTDEGGMDGAELLKLKVPDRKWFVDGWLSADEGYTVLFSGRGGTGKSALMLDLMVSLAVGEPWCGLEVQRGAKTMYVSCEDPKEELARRWQKRIGTLAGLPSGVTNLWSRIGKDNILCSADRNGRIKPEPFFYEVKDRARSFFGTSGGVLILDTLSDVFNGNENDRSQVSQFVKTYLNRLASDLGVTLIVLAHPAKSSSNSSQGFSGSTAWEGAFRCRWELNYQKSDRVDGLLELVHAKGNYRKAGSRITLENREGMFVVVDGAKADDWAKTELLRVITEAYEEGRPFGRAKNSDRPIANIPVCDIVTGERLSEEQIKGLVSEMLSEGKIEAFRTKDTRGLRPINDASVTHSELASNHQLKNEAGG